MGWMFKKRKGYNFKDAITVTKSVNEEYQIIADTPCDKCKRKGYEKHQGADKHGRFVDGKNYDLLHCKCKYCGHKRDFVFDICELPHIKKVRQLSDEIGEDRFNEMAERVNQLGMHGIEGKCPSCGTAFKLSLAQAAMGKECTGCHQILKLKLD